MRTLRARRKASSFEILPLEKRCLLSAVLDALASQGLRYVPAFDPSVVVEPSGAPAGGPARAPSDPPLTALPLLESRPGAPAKIFLDFDGHTFSGFWGPSSAGFRPDVTPAYDTDDDPIRYSVTELTNIQEIFGRVAEKFSPFNINVTTIDPLVYPDKQVVHVVIGGNGAWLGASAGGVAWIDSFTTINLPNQTFVFSKNLGSPKSVAEAAAHEVGHTLGLNHHGVWDSRGRLVAEYDPGNSDVAPIMGVGYYSNRSIWTLAATSDRVDDIQDDLDLITRTLNGFGYAADDAGDTRGTANVVVPTLVETFSASGIIGTNSDQDYYQFTTGAGPISLSVSLPVGHMLNAVLELRDANGALVAFDAPPGQYSASISRTVPAGTYFAVVKGDGTYGDLGQYDLDGAITSPGAVVGDTVWNDTDADGIKDDAETGAAGVGVTLHDASDDSVVANTVTTDSGTYVFSNLPAGTYYVVFEAPQGLIFTTQNVGADDTIDSDVNSSGQSADFTLGASTVNIDMDAGLLIPSIGIAGGSVTELDAGTTLVTYSVALRNPAATVLNVPYTTNSSGNATSGVDFVPTSGVLTFQVGETVKTFTVVVNSDTIIELDETIGAAITAPGGFIQTLTSTTATILDNDMPAITINDPSVTETDSGTSLMTFTVSLSATSPKTITVLYATTNGSAIAGQDYTATNGSLTFTPGQTSKTFTVTITNDNITEGNEQFLVNLSSPSGATIGDAQGVGTIVSDDLTTVTISDATVSENVTGMVDAVFTLTLADPVSAPVTFTYTTTDGSAVAGSDYVGSTGTVTFTPNQISTTLRIPVNSDFIQEDTENFTVALSSPVGAAIGTGTANANIVNQAVTTATFDANTPYKYTDFIGNRVTLKLTGPGTGTVSFTGAAGNDAKTIVLDGTTAETVFKLTTNGIQTSVVDFTVNGTIKTIDAAKLNLLGNMNVVGALEKLRLNFVSNANAITIGAGDGSITALSAQFNRVIDATFTSAIHLTQLKVNSWKDSDTTADITAPSIDLLQSERDFEADLAVAGNIGQIKMSRALLNSVIRVGGSIGLLQASTMNGAVVFAGVLDAVNTLPVSSAEFANTTSSIDTVTIRSKNARAFSNSLIAAPTLNKVNLGRVGIANNDTEFGVSAITINSIKGRNGQVFNLTNPDLIGNPFIEDDFIIRLTT